MKILIDMNIPPEWVNFLLSQQIESDHITEFLPGTAKDEDILHFAYDNEYAIFTCDMDFPRMMAESGEKLPSIILSRYNDLNIEDHGIYISQKIIAYSSDIENGVILTFKKDKFRIRNLPIEKNFSLKL